MIFQLNAIQINNQQIKGILKRKLYKPLSIRLTFSSRRFQGFFSFIEIFVSYMTEYQIENNRLSSTLRSILAYNSDLLSSIEGGFSFLKDVNFRGLQQRASDQKERIKRAQLDIENLVSKFDNLFSFNNNAKQIEQHQLNYQFETPTVLEQTRISQWYEDGGQLNRTSKVNTIQDGFFTQFEKNRILTIYRAEKGFTQDCMRQLVVYCLDFKPEGLNIDLRLAYSPQLKDINLLSELQALSNLKQLNLNLYQNWITDISPLGQLKHLVKLTNLNINLEGNKFLEDISPLSEFKALVSLTDLNINLRTNKVRDISSLREFKCLTNLICLNINLKDNNLPEGSILEFTNYVDLKEYFK